MRYQVITGVPDMNDVEKAVGNLAAVFELWGTDYVGRATHRINPLECLALRAPVFHVGEILIVNFDGREIGHLGRKASKWSVTYDEYERVEDAIERAKELTS